MIAKMLVKQIVISARPNWLRSIDKRGISDSVSLSATSVTGRYRDLIMPLFSKHVTGNAHIILFSQLTLNILL